MISPNSFNCKIGCPTCKVNCYWLQVTGYNDGETCKNELKYFVLLLYQIPEARIKFSHQYIIKQLNRCNNFNK